jgi:copper chaperone NosL
VAALAACGQSGQLATGPVELTRDVACSLDGMTLLDYPGPKAQVHYEQGVPDFFCDTVELFAVILRPEQQKRVRAIYVQDMGSADWTQPQGHWIDARTAFYVTGSKQRGSMGPTIASFAHEQDARALVARDGGRVLRFDEVKPEMAVIDGGVLKDQHS